MFKYSQQRWVTNLFSINPAAQNPNVLSAWVCGDTIPEVETMDDETIINDVSLLLNIFLSKKYNITKPERIVRYVCTHIILVSLL